MPKGLNMQQVRTILRKLWTDESGSEVLEYAVVTGLIAAVAISAAMSVGAKELKL